jgi:hypothetical protein
LSLTILPVLFYQLEQPHKFAFSGHAGPKAQRYAVHTIAQPRRLRAIIKHMAKMPAAAAALHGFPCHSERPVFHYGDASIERCPKTWPPSSAVKLRR